MIWHVPNDTPLHLLRKAASYVYYTDDDVLDENGRTLQKLYSDYATLEDPGAVSYTCKTN